MSKIAILYSGQPRHIKECLNNHLQTFYETNLDCHIDVFAHIWYDEAWIGNHFWEQYQDRGKWETGLKEFISEKWNPVKIEYEAPKSFISEDIIPDPRFPHPVNNIISMFYSIDKANKLKKEYEEENNFKYDCVVRLRTDEYFLNPIGPLFSYNMSCINVLDEWAHLDYGINDHFAFGSSELMDLYLNVYDNFVELCESGAAVNPECILGFNANVKYKLPIEKHKWTYKLWRDV